VLLGDSHPNREPAFRGAAVLNAQGVRGDAREGLGVPVAPRPERVFGARRLERRHEARAGADGQ
jgi:hypothetical protein